MAKINPLLGKGTGKVGAFLLQVNSGVQILKEKPVKVANPQTDAQVEQRAKLKLMSQLAADMAQSIGFQKSGLVSARNQFISKNIEKCTFEDNEAKIQLADIDLTPGSVIMPYPVFGQAGAFELVGGAPANVNAVLYALYHVIDSYRLALADQKIVTEAGAERKFPTTLENVSGQQICFVYGVTGTAGAGLVDYEDYEAADGGNFAVLQYVRRIVTKGGSLTKTNATHHTA